MLEKSRLENVTPSGTAAIRMFKNMARMHDWRYHPGIAGTEKAENHGWPGDWEGRTILALTLLAQALKTEPAYLDEIVDWVQDHCNAKGYRGDLLDIDAINEQSLSGHGWLLRGLIEYYYYKKDSKVKSFIQTIVSELFLPLKGHFAAYPRNPEERVYEGETAGDLAGITVSGWQVSSDTGCAFISLDGLTQAYELLKLPELKELIDEMISIFMTIDFKGITMKTHATLTASRGVMRMYQMTGNLEYLDFCKRIFELYKADGMTENYANYNWFCRPSWTEPCGVIDSFMLAVALWKETGNSDYLDDAHCIWYNGVCRGQRPNGGFGCDHCVEDGFVRTHEGFYEAYWCCSMRGGEGVTSAANFGLYHDNNRIVFPFYSDGHYSIPEMPGVVLKMASSYPNEGKIVVTVEKTSDTNLRKELAFFLPKWVKEINVAVNGEKTETSEESGFWKVEVTLTSGTCIELTFNIPLLVCPVIGNQHKGSGLVTLRHGTLVLGSPDAEKAVKISELVDDGAGRYRTQSATFTPLDQAYMLEESDLKSTAYRILYQVQ